MRHKINKKNKREISNALSMVTQIGLTMFFTIFISILFGKFLDDRFNTSPWLLLVFTILGILSAFRNLYDMVIKKWMK